MEISEAIEKLEIISAFDVDNGVRGSKGRCAIKMAISALYKQEPMTPRKNVTYYPYMQDLTVVLCPTCNRRLRTERTMAKGDQYCPDCGQKIDWSAEND